MSNGSTEKMWFHQERINPKFMANHWDLKNSTLLFIVVRIVLASSPFRLDLWFLFIPHLPLMFFTGCSSDLSLLLFSIILLLITLCYCLFHFLGCNFWPFYIFCILLKSLFLSTNDLNQSYPISFFPYALDHTKVWQVQSQ